MDLGFHLDADSSTVDQPVATTLARKLAGTLVQACTEIFAGSLLHGWKHGGKLSAERFIVSQVANHMPPCVTRIPQQANLRRVSANERRRHYMNGNGTSTARMSGGSPYELPDGQWCGLFAVDIVGFNSPARDDEIQVYVRKALYQMLEIAFDKADIPWHICAHEDRGDGVLVVVPPRIPVAGLVDPIPSRLRNLIRLHNRLSCEAARIQLRISVHVGPVHHDGHGFVGHDINLLYRLLDAPRLKRMISQSNAEIAFITSKYMYENVVRCRPSIIDPASFQIIRVQVKETQTQARAYVLGA